MFHWATVAVCGSRWKHHRSQLSAYGFEPYGQQGSVTSHVNFLLFFFFFLSFFLLFIYFSFLLIHQFIFSFFLSSFLFVLNGNTAKYDMHICIYMFIDSYAYCGLWARQQLWRPKGAWSVVAKTNLSQQQVTSDCLDTDIFVSFNLWGAILGNHKYILHHTMVVGFCGQFRNKQLPLVNNSIKFINHFRLNSNTRSSNICTVKCQRSIAIKNTSLCTWYV